MLGMCFLYLANEITWMDTVGKLKYVLQFESVKDAFSFGYVVWLDKKSLNIRQILQKLLEIDENTLPDSDQGDYSPDDVTANAFLQGLLGGTLFIR